MKDEDVANLSKVNVLYQEMVHDDVEFRTIDFFKLREPRVGYAEQTAIQSSIVDMATACAIYYSLHPGLIIRYIKTSTLVKTGMFLKSYAMFHLTLIRLMLFISNRF